MPDEKLGGRCREDGCFKPAGHPDDHGIGRSKPRNQLFDLAEVPVEKRQAINDDADAFVYRLLIAHIDGFERPE